MKHPLIRFAGWLFLFHLAASLLGVGLLFLTFELFGDAPALMLFGQFLVPCCLLWGFLTPKKARPEFWPAAAALSVYALLTWSAGYFLAGYTIVFTLPQFLAGTGLAQLWPGSHGSAWFLWTFEPLMQTLAHFLLPALLGLGLLLPQPRKEA